MVFLYICNLFGYERNDVIMEKKELYRRVGCAEQLFGARNMKLSGGKAEGMNVIEIYNASGMQAMVLPDRGMDIACLKLGGTNISFLSKTGLTGSKYFTENGAKGFLRSFYVGFLTTCGLTYMGAAGKDGEDELGLHGLISNTPAEELGTRIDWEGNMPAVVVTGSVKQAEVFGEHLVLRRTITMPAYKNEIIISDCIENRGLTPSPFMLLYHMNYGFPFLSPDCILKVPSSSVVGRDDVAKANIAKWNCIEGPVDGGQEQVFFHETKPDGEGNSTYCVINPKEERAIAVTYPSTILPYLTQWKCRRSGEYVLGLEPGNCHVMGRKAARESGELSYIQPLEQKKFTIKVDGFIGKEQIRNI